VVVTGAPDVGRLLAQPTPTSTTIDASKCCSLSPSKKSRSWIGAGTARETSCTVSLLPAAAEGAAAGATQVESGGAGATVDVAAASTVSGMDRVTRLSRRGYARSWSSQGKSWRPTDSAEVVLEAAAPRSSPPLKSPPQLSAIKALGGLLRGVLLGW
jgi:hypothetical protein